MINCQHGQHPGSYTPILILPSRCRDIELSFETRAAEQSVAVYFDRVDGQPSLEPVVLSGKQLSVLLSTPLGPHVPASILVPTDRLPLMRMLTSILSGIIILSSISCSNCLH